MRITWSTVLCAAAVLVLLLSGDEPGDGVPSGRHLSKSEMTDDVETTLGHARLRSRYSDAFSSSILVVAGGDRRLPQECIGVVNDSPVTDTAGNFTSAVRALVGDGWHTFHRSTGHGELTTELSKGGWNLTVSRVLVPADSRFALIDFFATDTTC